MNQDYQTRLPAFIVLSSKDIAARAYELYLKRGASDGFDRDDWFRAQRELRARGMDAERRRDGPIVRNRTNSAPGHHRP